MAPLRKTLKGQEIRALKLSSPLCVSRQMTLGQVLEQMKSRRKGCALVVEGERLVGIFTERDALTRAVEQKVNFSTPIETLMTEKPKTLQATHSIAEALKLMETGHYRHVPIVDAQENVQGILSVRDVVQFLAEHFPYEIYNLPPNPNQIIRAPEGA